MEFSAEVKLIFTQLAKELPKTLKMPGYITQTGSILDKAVSARAYVDYESLSASLGLNNPRHRSLGLALMALTAEDVSLDRPWRSSVVVGKNTEVPGPGYFDLMRRAGTTSGTETESWFDHLRHMKYVVLPNGEPIPKGMPVVSRKNQVSSSKYVVSLDDVSAIQMKKLAEKNSLTESEMLSLLIKWGLDMTLVVRNSGIKM
ncbi:MAG TPA: hypothetical protein VFO10_02750 [Oligoflexus sp.]|uniref:hypothetical protein n=1 Tax=Oligoflexus sp. TaxID=1971216 RepID=UPI002D7EC6F1|nr:hypothetical protein [Oligoflexus sp.]HET9236141.1 hypothetical protein [Oligoflexus sp.]